MVRRAARGLAFLVGVAGLASYVTALRGSSATRCGPARRGGRGWWPWPGCSRARWSSPVGTSPRGPHPAGGPGTTAGDHRSAAGDWHGDGHQHGVDRTPQRDVPPRAGPTGPARPGDRPWRRGLDGWMYLVGCADNFCWYHDSLRVAAPPGARCEGRDRTPAMAAGLPDHPGTMRERLSEPIPLPPWVPPKRRGRPPKRLLERKPNRA